MISPTVIADAARYRRSFQAALPFKHVCIDDFFTDEAAELSLRDFPPFDREAARNEFGEYGGKAVVTNIREISHFYARLYDYLMSRPFLDAMSTLTGISDLHGDPALYGGGTHENINGQDLDVHVDFNFQIAGGLHRRANLLLYLNKDWDPAWGGAIELHSDPRHPDRDEFAQFNGIFNRAVIFETNEYSWHGFRKIQLPAERPHISRKCLSIYLYTRDRPAHEIAGPHSTFYIQWPFPPKFIPEHVLSESDIQELRTGYARRDQQLGFYEKMVERLSRELQQPGAEKLIEVAPIGCDLSIDFGAAGNDAEYRRDGWAEAEEHHTWTIGAFSRLELPRPRAAGTYVIALEANPFVWPDIPGQRLTVLANGSEVGNFTARENSSFECAAAWSLLGGRNSLSLGFRHPNAKRPSEVGVSGDARELAFAFRRLYVFRLPGPRAQLRLGFGRIALSPNVAGPASIYLYADKARNGYFIPWPFPEKFAPGRILSDADVNELRSGYMRRDRQIELYQGLEERLGREIEKSRSNT